MLEEEKNLVEDNSLTLAEQAKLENCELVITTGLQTFVAVGNALQEIKKLKLYKENFKTFEEYCQSKWSLSVRHSNRLIEAAQVMENLRPIGPVSEELIDTESKARILAKYNPEIQKLIISDLENGGITQITANFLKGFADAYSIADQRLKAAYSNNFVFDSEEAIVDYVKEFITVEASEPTVVEKIVEVEPQESHQEKEVLKAQIRDMNDQLEKAQNKVEYEKRQSELFRDKHSEALKTVDDLQETIHSFDSKIAEAEKIKADVDKYNEVQNALFSFNELKVKTSELLKDGENISKILKAISEGKEFFQKHILYIGTLSVNEYTKEALSDDISEFIKVVDQWKFAMSEKFIKSNQLVEVFG